MSSNRQARNRSTTIYILLSVIVLFAGIAATVWGGQEIAAQPNAPGHLLSPTWFSVGTSLLAAGLASLGFAVVRRFDDIDSVELHEKLGLLRSARLIVGASERCFFDPDISAIFKKAVHDCPDTTVLVDVVGLKLYRFLNDQLQYLKIEGGSRKIIVRMLLQNPDSEHFQAICKLEARDEDATKEDILKTLTMLQGAKQVGKDLIYTDANLKVFVRFFTPFQPIASFRVGDTILIRPRIRSSGAGSRFYEAYDKQEGESYFGLYRDHFEACWSTSEFKVPVTLANKLSFSFPKG